MSYKDKYFKYKSKYNNLKNQIGSGSFIKISNSQLTNLRLTPLCNTYGRYFYLSTTCPDYMFESSTSLIPVPLQIKIKCWKSTNSLPNDFCEIIEPNEDVKYVPLSKADVPMSQSTLERNAKLSKYNLDTLKHESYMEYMKQKDKISSSVISFGSDLLNLAQRVDDISMSTLLTKSDKDKIYEEYNKKYDDIQKLRSSIETTLNELNTDNNLLQNRDIIKRASEELELFSKLISDLNEFLYSFTI